MILSCYKTYGMKNNWRYLVNDKTGDKPMRQISETDIDNLSFAYTQALQDFVVRGVKHTSNGSQDFEILFLRNASNQSNHKAIYSLLTNDLKLSSTLATKFIFIVTWAHEMDFIETCGAFLKLYNKGTIPVGDIAEKLAIREEFIQQNTYFGTLLKELYILRQHALKTQEITIKQKVKETIKAPTIVNGVFNPLSMI